MRVCRDLTSIVCAFFTVVQTHYEEDTAPPDHKKHSSDNEPYPVRFHIATTVTGHFPPSHVHSGSKYCPSCSSCLGLLPAGYRAPGTERAVDATVSNQQKHYSIQSSTEHPGRVVVYKQAGSCLRKVLRHLSAWCVHRQSRWLYNLYARVAGTPNSKP